MSAPPLYLLALGWGLAGGFSHCIGMCGVFVVAYAGVPPQKGAARVVHAERHVLFHGGRLLSLSVLGALAGTLGSITHRWAAAQGVLSLLAGVLMLALALGFSGVAPRLALPEPDVLGAGGGALREAFRRALQSRGALRPFFVGLFVGLLPCGLTYYALIPAALTRSAGEGLLTLLAFGLGTMPGLLTLALVAQAGGVLMSRRFRQGMTGVSAIIMAVMGAVFVWRGLTGL